MAKVQSFADKVKKKKGEIKPVVKVIKWYRCDQRGTLRTLERIVKVNDLNDVINLDIIK